LKQLVETTLDEKLGTRMARFLEGSTLQETAALAYPIESVVVFGRRQLAYDIVGNCVGAGHVESADREWPSLAGLPACDVLAFIGDDAIAYAYEGHLYVMDATGKRLATLRIPAPNGNSAPNFIGLSDDCTRLAISAVKKKHFSRGATYYREVLVYDLSVKRLLLLYPLPANAGTAALSPDGRQLATIEDGVLKLTPIP
jgi:hypothetical protein